MSKNTDVKIYDEGEKITVGGGTKEEADAPQEEVSGGSSEISVINIVDANRLEKSEGWTKSTFTATLKPYMKKLKEHIEKTDKAAADAFQKNATEVAKKVLGAFDDYVFYTGPTQDTEGMIIICHYKDGKTPVFWYWKHGLEEEKC